MPKQASFTRIKNLFIALFLINSSLIFSQNIVPFQERYENTGINGDLTMIGNSIVGNHPTDPYTGGSNNNDFDMVYIDVDSDASTFSSSSADLNLGNCSRVVYAGLYWGTNSLTTGQTPENIKFRLPTGGYQDITADVNFANAVFFKDVTSMITGLSNPNGTYFVANVPAFVDNDTSTNNNNRAAGWTLVVVFESPTEPSRYISIFDGLTHVAPFNSEQFQYSGFTTPPFGPVEGRIGVAALEGDRNLTGEQLLFADQLLPTTDPNSNFTLLSDAENPNNNFFNSKVTIDGTQFTTKNPNHTNTLGWDSKLLLLDENNLNSGNNTIANGATEATVRLDTQGDRIYPFLNTFSVNIIEPDVEVLTSVEDTSGNQVTLGSPVQLGETVWYNLNFHNVGTDDGENAYILNTLPINVTLDNVSFEFLDDAGNPLAPGLITYTFNPSTRVLRFDIDSSLLVRASDPNNAAYNIRYQVTASDQCFDYSDACTNVLINSLETFYSGASNPAGTIINRPGLNGVDGCGIGNPGAMELFVDTSSCQFDTVLEFCNNNLTISGDNGYNIYEWRDEDNNLLAANSKTITVTGPGVYTCTQTKVGCTVTERVVTVNGLDVEFTPFDNLCKDSADGGVTVNVTDDAATFTYVLSQGGTTLQNTGAITEKTHTFNNLDIGTYTVRVTNTDGCFDTFNFQVQEPTLLTASNVVLDNIMPCNGNLLSGRIEVSGNGGTQFTGGTNEYEYSMDGGAFQTSNIFETTVQGNHTITVRDANNCTTTTVANISFDEEIEYTVEKQDVLCYQGSDGNIIVNVSQNSAGNTLSYSIDGGTNFQSSSTFSGLIKGEYQIIIRKEKGVNNCDIVENVTLNEQIDLQFEATSDFSCEGAINTITATVDAQFANDVTYTLNGGSANSTGIFENVSAGEHTVRVTQNSTGCSAEPIVMTIASYTPVTFTVEQNISSPALRDFIVLVSTGIPEYEYAMLKNPSEDVSPEVTDEDFTSSNVFTPPGSGFYTFYVRDGRGCITEEIVEFRDIEIPNFFTPNGDSVNDEWYPRNIELYPNISVQIFDRYQRLVATYQGNDQSGWSGHYKGKELPSGDYWYIVRLNEPSDDREFKGNVTLYR